MFLPFFSSPFKSERSLVLASELLLRRSAAHALSFLDFLARLCRCSRETSIPQWPFGNWIWPERERDRVRDAGSGEVCARMLISAGCVCVCVWLWFNQEVRGVGVSFERKDERTVVGLFW